MLHKIIYPAKIIFTCFIISRIHALKMEKYMRIFPLTGTKVSPTNISCKASPKIKFPGGIDTFEHTQSKKPFETLTLKTFEKLRTLRYIPEKLDGYYSTYLIDKLTNKPVTALIKPSSINGSDNAERYDFYIYKKGEELERIGYRLIYVYDKDHEVYPAYVISPKNDRYAGMGIRAHQISIERMLEIGAPNEIINPTADAEPFHRACGFEWNKDRAGRMSITPKAMEEWIEFINSGQRIINK